MKRIGIILASGFIILIALTGCDSKVTNTLTGTTTNNIVTSQQEADTQNTNRVKRTDAVANNQNTSKTTYNDDLAKENEKLLFSFKIENSNKILSVCEAKDSSYIVYRFGTKGNIELEYPGDKSNSWNQFTYSNYYRGGGVGNAGLDLKHLSFDNSNYIYKVYEEYSAQDNSTNVGVRIADKSTNKETDIKGISTSKVGSLEVLKDRKVKHVEE